MPEEEGWEKVEDLNEPDVIRSQAEFITAIKGAITGIHKCLRLIAQCKKESEYEEVDLNEEDGTPEDRLETHKETLLENGVRGDDIRKIVEALEKYVKKGDKAEDSKDIEVPYRYLGKSESTTCTVFK